MLAKVLKPIWWISGFLPENQCIAEGKTSTEVSALWNVTCSHLNRSIPEKNLYLRDYFDPHFTRTFATYECRAGHGFQNGETQATLFCNSTGIWEPNPESLEPCEPISCNAPPIEIPENAKWNITYKLFFQSDISPLKTSLKVECHHDS